MAFNLDQMLELVSYLLQLQRLVSGVGRPLTFRLALVLVHPRTICGNDSFVISSFLPLSVCCVMTNLLSRVPFMCTCVIFFGGLDGE